MSGQCYGCGSSFSFMKKEHGCKNCGFSFCSKCLPHRLEVPKLNYEKHSVCRKCHDYLTGKAKPEENAAKFSPPEAYKKRIAALNERISTMNVRHLSIDEDTAPNKPTTRPPKLRPKYRGMSQEDMEIAERLERLKDRPGNTACGVTDNDIRSRLANLQGKAIPDQSSASKPFYQPPNRKTQQEQMDDLLDEILDEVNIDSHAPDPVADIESRLARLKEDRVPPVGSSKDNNLDNNLDKVSPTNKKSFNKNIEVGNTAAGGDDVCLDDMNKLIQQSAREMEVDAAKALADLQSDKQIMAKLNELKKKKLDKDKTTEKSTDSDSDNEDEDEEAKRIVKKFLEEAILDEASGNGEGSSGFRQKKMELEPEDDDDELPWCVMCNADAAIRCHGCDLDLYCSRCFRESHDELDMTDHETSKFIQRKQKSDSLD